MANYEKKNGDFTISKNNRQREGRKDPDSQIAVFWNGETIYIGAWNRQSQDGSRFASGNMQQFLDKVMSTHQTPIQPAQAPQPIKPTPAPVADDDLPF